MQPNALNMARYRKAVYSALWVQLVSVVCYVPQFAVEIVIFLSATRFSNFFLIYGMANVLVFFNSTLNPFLYCWKISGKCLDVLKLYFKPVPLLLENK